MRLSLSQPQLLMQDQDTRKLAFTSTHRDRVEWRCTTDTSEPMPRGALVGPVVRKLVLCTFVGGSLAGREGGP
jgi:hypothetical protein